LVCGQSSAGPVVWPARARPYSMEKVRVMMRRKTQGIPVAPNPCGAGRLTAHHSRRFPSGMGPRFASMRLKRRMASAGSRQGFLMTPGGAPMQPGCARDERAPAGAAPRSINWRHRLTPLGERGDRNIVSDRRPVKHRYRSWLADIACDGNFMRAGLAAPLFRTQLSLCW